jgi:hypothetical protein
MILEYSVGMIHAVSTTILQQAAQAFSTMLTGALKEKLAEQAMSDRKFMDGKFTIEDHPTKKDTKIYTGEDGFVGNLTRIMTRRYAFKHDKLLGEDIMLSDMSNAILLELQKPMWVEGALRISPANVIITMQNGEVHVHGELFIASLAEIAKPVEELENNGKKSVGKGQVEAVLEKAVTEGEKP